MVGVKLSIPARASALVWLSLYATLLQAADTPKAWLERMLAATRSLSYEGTFVYVQGQSIEAMHIANSGVSGRQRMASLTGPLREVVVKDDEVICLLPQQKVALNAVNQSRSLLPVSFPYDLSSLETSYRFEMLGEDRVADRPTQIIAVQPLDQYRYGYRLWLDHETAIVLRSALVDHDQQFLEQLLFVSFETKPDIDRELLRPRLMVSRLSVGPGRMAPLPVGPSPWQVGATPDGFRQISIQHHPAGDGLPATEQRVFSDGLATVSVFIEPLADPEQPLLDGVSKMHSVNAFGRVIDGHQVLVVGEVPVAAAQLIGSAIHLAETP